VTWQAREIVIESRERCGARALIPVNGLAEYPANADGAITAEGDNLAIWCKAAAEMIFGHTLAPKPRPATGQESLTDPTFLRRNITVAEHYWHTSARHDLRCCEAGDALGRLNNASAAALNLTEAHIIGQAADVFATVIARASDPRTRAALHDLHVLFLLNQVNSRSGLLLAEGILSGDQVRALTHAQHALTARLAPQLPALTDAFSLPEAHLSSLPMLTAP
jgi:acyl-CoA oxidase